MPEYTVYWEAKLSTELIADDPADAVNRLKAIAPKAGLPFLPKEEADTAIESWEITTVESCAHVVARITPAEWRELKGLLGEVRMLESQLCLLQADKPAIYKIPGGWPVCPKCGMQAEVNGHTGAYYVECQRCHLEGYKTETVEDAVKLWNGAKNA
jgi:hypothetical protein